MPFRADEHALQRRPWRRFGIIALAPAVVVGAIAMLELGRGAAVSVESETTHPSEFTDLPADPITRSIIVIIEPMSADVVVYGQPEIKNYSGTIGLSGEVGSAFTITLSAYGRSHTEKLTISGDDGHQYKVALPDESPWAPRPVLPKTRIHLQPLQGAS